MQQEDFSRLTTQQGNPLIERDRATFVWFGEDAPALMGDFTEWAFPVAMQPAAPGVWSYTRRFREDAYIEYAFFRGETRVPDPLNPRSTPNGMGATNHYFYMPAGAPTPLATPVARFPAGRVTRHQLPCIELLTGKTRAVWLYQPPVETPVPLWVVWDGKDYLRRTSLVTILENLVSAGRISPVALALVDNGGAYRFLEYVGSEATLLWLTEVLLPFAANELNLIDVVHHPGAYGVLGASMGGLMALHSGLRMPQVFGKVLSQSGGFTLGNYQPLVHYLAAHGPLAPVDIWMDVGIYEGLLEPNRQMVAELRARNYRVTYHEYPAGHNYPAWRDDIWRGLEALLGQG